MLRKKAEETRVSSAFIYAFCESKKLPQLCTLHQKRLWRFFCVIPQARRIVLRRGKWISQKFRRIFALDVRTRLSLSDSRRVLWL